MEINIGKYTLETLTTGMYDSPKDLYREYIQNAVDSIDVAVAEEILDKDSGYIDVIISTDNKYIKITDNGTGVSQNNIERFLLDIGNSKKISTSERGFRGIGRLAGLAYCNKLLFETSYKGESFKSIIEFDAKKLRESLSNNNYYSLTNILENIVIVRKEKAQKCSHYFKVEMYDVDLVDDLLSTEVIENYLSQVAPVKFAHDFKWKTMLQARINYIGQNISEYNIFIQSDYKKRHQIFKQYKDTFLADRFQKIEDSIQDIETEVFYYGKNPIAFLWYAKSNFCGTIQEKSIKGIRLRKGNIQLGNKSTLNHIFKDERFNGWMLGELHILSNELIPNARRDNLEKNSVYEKLIFDLKKWAEVITYQIRQVSLNRNKKVKEVIQNIENKEKNQNNIEFLDEIRYDGKPEYDEIAHNELINSINIMLNKDKSKIKYKALELQDDITIEHKKVLEKVFDIILNCHNSISEDVIKNILYNFKSN